MTFDKNFTTYDNNAIVQKKVAANLSEYIKNDISLSGNMNKIIELGCGTGIFTKEFLSNFTPKHLTLNDFFDVREYLKNLNYNEFIQGDIEIITLPKADIIISSSAFQWVSSFEKLINNISASTNNLAFSIYTKGNLKEIYEHFNISLNYLENEEIHQILRKKFKNITSKKETIILKFNTPLEALRHLKNTGVTGFQKTSISKIRSFSSYTLTYEISYFICKN
ncbi:MAG: methyltransferase domain-containing protein [Fusobacterium varium]|uniref:methyltransferase domain-containing protein n=1 Tax=Fusobacterium varium TaxID=856 RepID=UPI00242D07D2|nr:methyltransferase domain-containing protein [Fusobacterium varium]UYI79970.1 MAG: methyltransferase domain-containing protein [Fusobacterium varium]